MKITLVGLCMASLQVMTSYGIQVHQAEDILDQMNDDTLIQIANESDAEFCGMMGMGCGGCNPCNHCKTPKIWGGGNAPQHVHYHIPPCTHPKKSSKKSKTATGAAAGSAAKTAAKKK